MQPSCSNVDEQAPLALRADCTERPSLLSRAPYVPPVLERLGPWEAFTLQQSIPIFP